MAVERVDDNGIQNTDQYHQRIAATKAMKKAQSLIEEAQDSIRLADYNGADVYSANDCFEDVECALKNAIVENDFWVDKWEETL